MKYVLATAAILVSTSAYADNVRSQVRDHYRNETVSTPVYTNKCYDVDVPIYGEQRSGASGGDVLAGMIIGGILGKGITGKDNGAAAGAVMGGVIAADKGSREQVVTGYRKELQCFEEVLYENKTERVYTHSTITFAVDGKQYTLEFKK